MYRNKKIIVVVPAYNEAKQIVRVIETIPVFVDYIVIIDDKSLDNTVEVIQSHPQFTTPRLHLIKHTANQGVGGAIATGYEWSRDHDIDIAVVMAGDGQMDPHDLPALLDPVVNNQADYSKGNRLVSGKAFQKIPKIRLIGNALLSLLTKIASGYWAVADSQTGYTAINHRALAVIDWSTLYKRYGQPNDLLVKLNVAEMRVIDVPIEPVYNVGEKSDLKIHRVIFSISWLLLKLFFWRLKEKYIIRNFHPLVFFYFSGLFFFGTSILLFLRLLIRFITLGYIPEITFIGWLFSIALGFNALFFAMWFDYEINKHLNPPMNHHDAFPIKPKI
jgi:glycosyltransferase involved in cell wall biosynthesis